jgi:pSer/pThr/pTyr-binding forkhead associated (FHA) protein/thioredoxin reductase/ferredoxin
VGEKPGIQKDGSLILKKPVKLPEILDLLIVGGGPGGTACAFRAKELGMAALVIDFDDLMKRIRDYPKEKDILPDFGGGDKMRFPLGGEVFNQLHFPPIDKDDMVVLWRKYYYENNVPAKIGVEFTGLERQGDLWKVRTWNHNIKTEENLQARHVVISMGRGVPRRFDIPGNTDGIAYRLSDPADYVKGPVLVIGGGTSAAEAVIAISNVKAKAKDPCAVYWSYRGAEMPKISKALADVFFEAYMGNGNIRYHPLSEPAAVVVSEDRKEYLSLRIDRKRMNDRPCETTHLEFRKESCIACIGEDIPEAFLKSLGINMVTVGEKKRMVLSPLLETQLPNVYLIGAILAPAYFVTEDFRADPSSFREEKHRDNIKSALIDGMYVTEVIAQKLAGKKDVRVELKFAEPGAVKPVEQKRKIEIEQTIRKAATEVDKEGPPLKSVQAERQTAEALASITRIISGGIEETDYPLKVNGITTIGRQGCDINFPDDTMLSDKHASISHGPEGYFLRDDGSATGVYLRASEGRPLEVAPGNLVRAGRQFLLFNKNDGKYQFIHYNQSGKEIKRYDLPDKTVFVGRDAPDVILDQQDKTLSRRHLSISVKDNKIFIKDLKSVNGTYLKVKNAVKLEHGDRFRAGQQNFSFALKDAAAMQSLYLTGRSIIAAPPKEPAKKAEAKPEVKPKEVKAEPAKSGEMVITFHSLGRVLEFNKGQTICEVAEENGLPIQSECHAGLCGMDPIRIISGQEFLNKLSDDEEATIEDCQLNPKECRMACMVKPSGPVVVDLIQK